MAKGKVTVSTLAKRWAANEKIVMVTAYDSVDARLVTQAGIDVILVGDSVAMARLGYNSTIPVDMEDMIHHTKAVRRAAPDAFIVFDMPFMSYQTDEATALANAGRAIKETGADAVKLEGGAYYAPLIEKMVRAGIPVVGHIGLLPQRVQALGGYKVTGKNDDSERELLEDAQKIANAGACAVVLECVTSEVAQKITQTVAIPTIGIGSGTGCSGQVQVITDLLGLGGDFIPKHAKRYVDVASIITQALKTFASEVKEGTFPTEANTFHK